MSDDARREVAEIGAQLLARVDRVASDVHEMKTTVAVMASKIELVEDVAKGLRDHEIRLTKVELWAKIGTGVMSLVGTLLLGWFIGRLTGLL